MGRWWIRWRPGGRANSTGRREDRWEDGVRGETMTQMSTCVRNRRGSGISDGPSCALQGNRALLLFKREHARTRWDVHQLWVGRGLPSQPRSPCRRQGRSRTG